MFRNVRLIIIRCTIDLFKNDGRGNGKLSAQDSCEKLTRVIYRGLDIMNIKVSLNISPNISSIPNNMPKIGENPQKSEKLFLKPEKILQKIRKTPPKIRCHMKL